MTRVLCAALAFWLIVLATAGRAASFVPVEIRDHENFHYFAIRTSDIDQVKSKYPQFRILGNIGHLEDYYVVQTEKELDTDGLSRTPFSLFKRALAEQQSSSFHMDTLSSIASVEWVSHQKPRKRQKRLPIDPQTCENVRNEFHFTDVLFPAQWHLNNCEIPGNDLNVTPVWRQGVFGENVVVCIVDDGVDMDHPDLKDNYYPDGSYDFNDHNPVPKPRLYDDRHGTRCAGEVAAIPNDVCGVGVAYKSKISALRILSAEITEADEAAAVQFGIDKNHIYSCSWGPSDDGRTLEAPSQVVKDAFLKGIREGRDGKGVIYVFATGNGGFNEDNCNYDGYTNSMYTLTVGAITQTNDHPPYSEMCSAQLCVTYSSSMNKFIQTTDFHNSCARNHGGTSAAAPLAAGVFALALSVRPDLTWRDVQHIVVLSAIPVNVHDSEWQKTPAGLMVSHKYGFGKVDAAKTIQIARDHVLLNPQVSLQVPQRHVNLPVEGSDGTCVRDSVYVSTENLLAAGLRSLEHVTVTFSASHERRGALEIVLISPGNVRSILGAKRGFDDSKSGFKNWTFLSVFHWKEPAAGNWTLEICNRNIKSLKGVFESWQLTLYGESGVTEAVTTTAIPATATAASTILPTAVVSTTPTVSTNSSSEASNDAGLFNGSTKSIGSAALVLIVFVVCVGLFITRKVFISKAVSFAGRIKQKFSKKDGRSYHMIELQNQQSVEDAFE